MAWIIYNYFILLLVLYFFVKLKLWSQILKNYAEIKFYNGFFKNKISFASFSELKIIIKDFLLFKNDLLLILCLGVFYYEHRMDYEIEIADSQRQRNVTIKYSGRYRWLKSILLVLTWISFGLNFELIGITLEDLKIYLSVNYTQISAGPVLRNIGYCSLTILLGAFLDGIKKYSDLLMVLASILIAISKYRYLIQIKHHIKNYALFVSYLINHVFWIMLKIFFVLKLTSWCRSRQIIRCQWATFFFKD